MNKTPHIPVMLNEVLAALKPAANEAYIDGTFGAGGYTSAILDAASCVVLAIDQDETALQRGAALKDKFGERLHLLRGNFADAGALIRAAGIDAVDGFVLDLGVSSMQLDQAERGFSFRQDGPLDMRMDQTGAGETAADIVNGYEESDLADIIYHYGEERHSRRVARAILEGRPFTRTLQLAETVRAVVPKNFKSKIDPATRTFQGLRIAVNRELDVLRQALVAAESVLREDGRLVVVSFHSLEDTIVKQFLADRSGRLSGGSRYLPENPAGQIAPTFSLPSGKATFPTDEESSANPRARSARLRVGIRTAAPARSNFPGKPGERG
jgi:16S rRNA (cytosine1402-N4)-methyltransferase